MRKKNIYSFAVLAIAATVAWNVNLSSKGSEFSDMALANVEALAKSEWIPDDCGWNGCSFDPLWDCHLYFLGLPMGVCPFMRGWW